MLFDGSECYIRLANSQSTSIDNILMKIQNGNQTIREICTINQGIVSGADYVSEKHLSKYPISSQNVMVFLYLMNYILLMRSC